MKRLFISITILSFLYCFTIGCQQGEEVTGEYDGNVKKDIQVVKDIIEEWCAATTAGDLDSVMTHYADDVVMIQPNMPAFHGKDTIRTDFQQWFNNFNLQEEDVIKDIQVSSDLAIAHVIWETKQAPKSGGETNKIYGNWIIVFKRQHNDTWSCIYTIWSDETLIYPTQAG